MTESRGSDSVIREKQFAWFSVASATYLDLGLTLQQWINLCKECLEVAELHSDLKLRNCCITALAESIQYCEEELIFAKVNGIKEMELSVSFKLANNYEKMNAYKEAIWYINNALRIAHAYNIRHEKREMCMYFQLIRMNIVLDEQDEVIKYGKMYLDIAVKSGNKVAEMRAYSMLWEAHLNKEENDDAILYGEKCLITAEGCSNNEKEMAAYHTLGQAHTNKKEYDNAISYGKKYLIIAQECSDKVAEMNAYIILGNAHLKKKEYDDAISYCKKNLIIAQGCSYKVAEMNAHIIVGNAHQKKEEYDDAISYGKKCLIIAQGCSNKMGEMNAYIILGNNHLKKEECDDAISYAKKSLIIAQECSNKVAEMNAYIILGNAHLMKEENDDAISYCKKILIIAEGCSNEEAEMNVYITLGHAHLNKEEYDNAISYGKQCLIIARGCSDKVPEMTAYYLLGGAHLHKGENDEAISYGEKCLDMAQRYGDKVMEMNAYVKLGNAYLNKEEYDDAISYCKTFLIIAKGCSYKVAEKDAYAILGNACLNKEEYDCCYTYLTQCKEKKLTSKATQMLFCFLYEAVGLSEELLGTRTIISIEKPIEPLHSIQEKRSHWFLFHDYYLYYRSRGEYKKAIDCLEGAIKVGSVMHGNGAIALRPDLLRIKINISDMYVLLGQYDEALQNYQETLGLALNQKYSKHSQAACHFGLGNAYYHLGELENAEKSFKESIKCFEHIFDHLGQNDPFKIAIVDKYENIYKMLLKVLVELNKEKKALCLSEHVRARALKDLLVTRYGMKKDEIGKEDLRYNHVQALVFSNNYCLLVFSICIGELYTFLVEKSNDLGFSVQHFEYCDEYFDKLVDRAFEGMQVRQVINSENRSIDTIDEEIKEPHQKEDELTQLLRRRKENQLLERSRSACDSRGDPSENSDKSSITNCLEILYKKLIGNVKCLIKEDEIVIIPEGPLYKVPFPALRDPDTGQYLSESKLIRLAPSMTTLRLIQEIPVDHHCNRGALIIGDPKVGRVKMDGKEQVFVRLKYAQEEAADISSILGVVPLYGEEATKPAVIKKLQEGVSVVHIAAHGNLSKATILLATSPKIRAKKIPEEEDYMLTMADVQKAHVRAQLVVLSCCHSGRGEIRAEGVVGMCRAFLASGARAVIGSLWAIDDKATRKFMKTFYEYLKDGKSASTSLHLSMKDMRNKPQYSEPKYWAPFFLMGDDVTIQF